MKGLAVHVMPESFTKKSREAIPAGEWEAAVESAVSSARDAGVALEGFQIFLAGPVAYNRILAEDGVAAMRMQPLRVVVHSPYMPNFMHEDSKIRKSSRKFLGGLLHSCMRMRAEGLVLHLKDVPAVEIAEGCREILEHAAISALLKIPQIIPERRRIRLGETLPRRPSCALFLETEASSRVHGYASRESLRDLLRALGSMVGRVGICVDTAHLHSQGVNIGDGVVGRKLSEDISDLLDIQSLRCPFLLHFNDNQVPIGKFRDQHAAIAQGEIWRDDPDAAKCWLDLAQKQSALVVLERRPNLLHDDYKFLLK